MNMNIASVRPSARTRVVTKAKRSAKNARVTKKSGGEGGLGLDFGSIFKGSEGVYDNAASGSKAISKEKAVGYKATGEKGSAPAVDAQGRKARLGGVVYQFSSKYGGNIDEYSPIWTPETRQPGADTYEPGLLGIAVWFVGFVALIGTGLYTIYSTSALAN